jgi:hypothetical protein
VLQIQYCYRYKIARVINNLAFISLKIGPMNPEALVIASKETGLDVNADKTKYMGMSRDQNAGRSHNIMIDISSERVQ